LVPTDTAALSTATSRTDVGGPCTLARTDTGGPRTLAARDTEPTPLLAATATVLAAHDAGGMGDDVTSDDVGSHVLPFYSAAWVMVRCHDTVARAHEELKEWPEAVAALRQLLAQPLLPASRGLLCDTYRVAAHISFCFATAFRLPALSPPVLAASSSWHTDSARLHSNVITPY
jgi:hypothetical protein